MSEREIAVRVSCVRHVYADRTQVHLCGLDFVVERGQRVVILGPNGCGKSTLLYHILGLLEPHEGDVTVFGVHPARSFNKIRERVGVVLQNVDEQILAPTVWDDVSFSPRNYGYGEAEVERRSSLAMEALKQAVAAGYRNAALIAEDRDLEALRARKDFQVLTAELQVHIGKGE